MKKIMILMCIPVKKSHHLRPKNFKKDEIIDENTWK